MSHIHLRGSAVALVVDHWTTNKKIVGSNPVGVAGCVLE